MTDRLVCFVFTVELSVTDLLTVNTAAIPAGEFFDLEAMAVFHFIRRVRAVIGTITQATQFDASAVLARELVESTLEFTALLILALLTIEMSVAAFILMNAPTTVALELIHAAYVGPVPTLKFV